MRSAKTWHGFDSFDRAEAKAASGKLWDMEWTAAERQARREKREARRAAERLRSVARAEAMHHARCEANGSIEPVGSIAESERFWVGTSGWYYWHWRDRFYPPGSKSCDWFAHFADQFRTVELNAPFYSWPTIGTVKSWVRQAGRRKFVYTIKVNELITHERRFVRTKELVRDFYHIANLLGPHMGCFLFQLPPSFRYSAKSLDGILRQLDPRWRNVLEFRHASWWNERVIKRLRDANVIFCSCSGPKLPDELVRTSDELYIRFHGTKRWYRHDYSPEELAVWTQRVRESGATRTWAYFNNDRECYPIKNALEFRRQLKNSRVSQN